MLAEPIKKILGQPFVVVVKPGGQGIIGQNAMAKAKPDGYTIGLAALGPMVTVHLYTPKPPYKMTDFEPICGFYRGCQKKSHEIQNRPACCPGSGWNGHKEIHSFFRN
jgi:hypothetical protein